MDTYVNSNGATKIDKIKLLLREKIVADIRVQKLYKRLLSTNTLDNAIDELVIYKNSWMLYGSKKPENQPYGISFAFRYKADGTFKRIVKDIDIPVIDRVKKFSIRNKGKCNKIKDECVEEVSKIEAKFEKKSIVTHSNTSNNTVIVSKNDEDIISKLVDILNPQRAESYDEWLKNWVRDDNVPFKVTKKNEFLKVLERKLGKSSVSGGCVRFKGYKIRNRYQKGAVDDDNDDIDF
eukprot:gene9107-16229_t